MEFWKGRLPRIPKDRIQPAQGYHIRRGFVWLFKHDTFRYWHQMCSCLPAAVHYVPTHLLGWQRVQLHHWRPPSGQPHVQHNLRWVHILVLRVGAQRSGFQRYGRTNRSRAWRGPVSPLDTCSWIRKHHHGPTQQFYSKLNLQGFKSSARAGNILGVRKLPRADRHVQRSMRPNRLPREHHKVQGRAVNPA